MAIRDFGLFCLICMVWGMNMIVSRWVFIATDIEPLFYAGMRFGMIALVLFPLFFRRWPSDLFKLFLISLCIGSAHFGLLFIGLANASASSAAVVGQLAVPFTTLLSILFLNEKVGWRRGLGIVMAFLGVIIISVNPSEFSVSTGLLFVVGSAFCASIGSILMKQITRMPGVHMQAWVGVMSFLPLFVVSAFLEGGEAGLGGQFMAFAQGGWLLWLATAFAVLGVSIFGHGSFYVLITKYDVSLLSPLTLMVPVWGVIFGVMLLGEPFTVQFLIGGVVSLAGVLIIALRPNTKLPFAVLAKKMVGSS
ncbi:DMT family transporter [Ponticaulis profundi]|uniref:DMT family transporter n=1 Tax=Ponticaulis profundi TaxID=2665222 RepID=A0ABW1S6F1_9PROT